MKSRTTIAISSTMLAMLAEPAPAAEAPNYPQYSLAEMAASLNEPSPTPSADGFDRLAEFEELLAAYA